MPVRSVPILVAIETDPTCFHGEHARKPVVLERAAAEQVLAHLGADLARLLPEMAHHALAMPGALYDMTQLLRPGYPLLAALQPLLRDSQARSYAPSMLSIGASNGLLPVPELQPDPAIVPGPLQLLVLMASGEADGISQLGDRIEHLFLEQGQVSAQSARALEAQFGLAITHARFMTLTDLEAMLRMQLEHFGFLPLWELLDAALQEQSGSLRLNAGQGQQFHWDGQKVLARFETFDYWASHGGGQQLDTGQLEQAYCDWTRGFRRYLLTLDAHGVAVEVCLPGQAGSRDDSFLVEASDRQAPEGAAAITEHVSQDVGTVAVTVVVDGQLQHYYPLAPAGLNDLHAQISARHFGNSMAIPGGIIFDHEARALQPDLLPPA